LIKGRQLPASATAAWLALRQSSSTSVGYDAKKDFTAPATVAREQTSARPQKVLRTMVMTQLPKRPALPDPRGAAANMARSAVRLLLLSLASFAVAFALRRIFFSDVKPVSWDETPPQTGALEAAFLLLSIENVAAVVAAIALVFVADVV
jgi:hypothetical protein